MSPSTENLVLEHLRAIRATQDKHSEDLREIKVRLGIIEMQDANLSNRLDRQVIAEYVEVAREQGLLLFLDLQIGWSGAGGPCCRRSSPC